MHERHAGHPGRLRNTILLHDNYSLAAEDYYFRSQRADVRLSLGEEPFQGTLTRGTSAVVPAAGVIMLKGHCQACTLPRQ